MNTPKKILVIEDDADIREVIRFILDEEGYQISELPNGHGVNEELARSTPDLILLDVLLGDMDGRDICAQLKSESATAGIPIIIVSATHGRQSIAERDCKADDFLQKPFNIIDLIDKVKFYSAA